MKTLILAFLLMFALPAFAEDVTYEVYPIHLYTVPYGATFSHLFLKVKKDLPKENPYNGKVYSSRGYNEALALFLKANDLKDPRGMQRKVVAPAYEYFTAEGWEVPENVDAHYLIRASDKGVVPLEITVDGTKYQKQKNGFYKVAKTPTKPAVPSPSSSLSPTPSASSVAFANHGELSPVSEKIVSAEMPKGVLVEVPQSFVGISNVDRNMHFCSSLYGGLVA